MDMKSKSVALSILSHLDFEAKKIRFPNVPLANLPLKAFKQNSANEIEKSVVHCLHLHGFQASRVKLMGRPVDTRKTYTNVLGELRVAGSLSWMKSTGTKGMADVDAGVIPKGGTYAASVKIEVKYNKDRQSADQKRYEAQVVQGGGVYLLIKSYDDFWTWFEEFTGINTYSAHLALVLQNARKPETFE